VNDVHSLILPFETLFYGWLHKNHSVMSIEIGDLIKMQHFMVLLQRLKGKKNRVANFKGLHVEFKNPCY